jgi:uncharacterized heparinase superfamily protein
VAGAAEVADEGAARRLRTRVSLWRRLGARRGTAAVVRVTGLRARAPFRARRLRRCPLGVAADELHAALGSRSAVGALRGPVLAALPTVSAFERELNGLSDEERAALLSRADALLAHRFDLLGSGEVDLGPETEWHRDFKSGRRWPSGHIFQLPLRFSDGSDVLVPWELSRFQHLPLIAAAGRVTGDPRYLDEIGQQLEHWIASNPVEIGVNWACTMEVAIRAANWIATLALCAEAAEGEPWFDGVVGSLLLHGRFVRRHLERSTARNNHYLSNVVGLLTVAALFSGSREGRAWAEWGARELVREMEFQVRRDGCAFEASASYHRLVCELFICGTQALDALAGPPPDWYGERLERMLEFVADYTRADGLAPQIGDTDDGRWLPLGDYARADPRWHLHLFRQAGREHRAGRAHAAYPHGGYYVMRGGDLYALVRCGDVGNDGNGWHAHNDQLSFELAFGAQPMVIDPGTYLYTAEPEARNLFRSTAFHSTLQVGACEQNELHGDNLFLMRDRSRAESLGFDAADGHATFEGRHHGFESLDPPATHSRRFEFDGPGATLTIRDTVSGTGAHLLRWALPLAPCQVGAHEGEAVADFDDVRLVIQADGLDFSVEQGWYSPSYGVRVATPFLRADRRARPGRDVTTLVLRADRR